MSLFRIGKIFRFVLAVVMIFEVIVGFDHRICLKQSLFSDIRHCRVRLLRSFI